MLEAQRARRARGRLSARANPPAPEVIAADVAADLEAALEQFATIADDLKTIR